MSTDEQQSCRQKENQTVDGTGRWEEEFALRSSCRKGVYCKTLRLVPLRRKGRVPTKLCRIQVWLIKTAMARVLLEELVAKNGISGIVQTARWESWTRPRRSGGPLTGPQGSGMVAIQPQRGQCGTEEGWANTMQNISSLEPTKKVFSLFEEFKNFAFKGNVVDLAVGVIIGAAFGSIVKSLVDNIIMPLVGLVLPAEKGYEDWTLTIGQKTMSYGKFIGDVVNFLIVAFVLYLFIVKFLGWVMKNKQAEPPPPPTRDQELLMEIRDLLKAGQAASERHP